MIVIIIAFFCNHFLNLLLMRSIFPNAWHPQDQFIRGLFACKWKYLTTIVVASGTANTIGCK